MVIVLAHIIKYLSVQVPFVLSRLYVDNKSVFRGKFPPV